MLTFPRDDIVSRQATWKEMLGINGGILDGSGLIYLACLGGSSGFLSEGIMTQT